MVFGFLFKKKKQAEKDNSSLAKPTESKKNSQHWANRKGELGEYKITIQLDQFSKNYMHHSDLLIKNDKSSTGYSQIDHVIITPYGIFVIETKNYQGTIYGGKDRKTWLINGKFKMMSPLLQNYGHIQAIKNLIDINYHEYFISMVAFTKRCTFKIDEELRKINSNQLVVYDIELTEFINRKIAVLKLQYKEPFLSNQDINSIHDALSTANILDPSIRKQHVESIKNNNATKKDVHKCSICHKPVSDKVKTYCLSNKRFNGNVYCFEHQKNFDNK
ncbi:nuclease-related domain-containing protein [Rummeliibacillus stabekisii]|uniref:NERD nuclease n=1 Tax=Rummeliibacillus stabekisii TaxID=241244 RepID=A0A143H897_9BACL|nr:nuclease-related domain-containing protein [Rummeliibacillus stabekisii]AMW97947.1 NERD nuclease [Rummeliibacillus stabekisii]